MPLFQHIRSQEFIEAIGIPVSRQSGILTNEISFGTHLLRLFP